MKFGKFEVSEYIIGIFLFVLLIFVILHFTYAEEKLKEETKQLEIQKQITEIESRKEV